MVERRDPGIVLLLSFITCGFYLIYWYYRMYEELTHLTGETPTGRSFGVDFLLNILTCSIYGVWVDYRISVQLNDLYRRHQMAGTDSTTAAIMLDVAAYITGFVTNYITSAIQQDQLNKLMAQTSGAGAMTATP